MEVRKSALDFGQVQWDWKGNVSTMVWGLLFLGVLMLFMKLH